MTTKTTKSTKPAKKSMYREFPDNPLADRLRLSKQAELDRVDNALWDIWIDPPRGMAPIGEGRAATNSEAARGHLEIDHLDLGVDIRGDIAAAALERLSKLIAMLTKARNRLSRAHQAGKTKRPRVKALVVVKDGEVVERCEYLMRAVNVAMWCGGKVFYEFLDGTLEPCESVEVEKLPVVKPVKQKPKSKAA